MKVYLSPNKPEEKYNAWISNIATLDGQVLDSEATQIIADQFLSMFTYHEVDQIISKISKKMRLGCELTIIEPDFNLVSQQYIRDDFSLGDINHILFNGSYIKSVLNLEEIIHRLPSHNLSISQKFFNNQSAQMTIKCRRDT
tara:strand:+ start:6014 stop:6439 length:426 start_codon:yes stop_codon:yes gene_type:complete